jgi:hypothetical protein
MGPLRGAVVLFKVGVLLLAGATHLGAATLDDAQRLFYTALFQESAAAAKSITDAEPENLAAWEVRTSALHFQLRRLLGEPKDRKAAMAKCAECRALLATFLEDVNTGRTAARARIAKAPDDEEARFFLGKLDLSYLWMQLSTLGKKTGWDEYWEAKRILEAMLEKNPMHVRARVARAWMDYIVGTRVPWGTRRPTTIRRWKRSSGCGRCCRETASATRRWASRRSSSRSFPRTRTWRSSWRPAGARRSARASP